MLQRFFPLVLGSLSIVAASSAFAAPALSHSSPMIAAQALQPNATAAAPKNVQDVQKPTAQMIHKLFETIVQQAQQLMLLDKRIDALLNTHDKDGCLNQETAQTLAKYLYISAGLIENLDQHFATATDYLDAFESTDPEFELFTPLYQVALALPQLMERFEGHAARASGIRMCTP